MPFRDDFKITVLLTLGKMKAAKSLYCLAAVFLAVLAYAGMKDTPAAALKFFLFLFPYVFLLLTQDMVRGEIDSGSLENVIFLRQDFRRYLLGKNAVIALLGGLISFALFGILVLASARSRRFDLHDFAELGAGLVAGLYYTSLGGFLSYFLKAGSNVLVIFLGQAAVAVSFLLSAGLNTGFLQNLSSGFFPDFPSRLKFIGFVALLPNTVVSRKFLPWMVEVAGLSLVFFWLQFRMAARLELKKK
jgi:hypothetical protein